MPTEYILGDPATSSLQYEHLQVQVITHYYIQYGIELIIIFFVAVGIAKVIIWRNWLTEMFNHKRV